MYCASLLFELHKRMGTQFQNPVQSSIFYTVYGQHLSGIYESFRLHELKEALEKLRATEITVTV